MGCNDIRMDGPISSEQLEFLASISPEWREEIAAASVPRKRLCVSRNRMNLCAPLPGPTGPAGSVR